jgi:hypothetical protein
LHARADELALRQAELRVTFENMGDGVALYDDAQRLVAWNRKFQEVFDVPDSLLEPCGTCAEHVRYLAKRSDYGCAATGAATGAVTGVRSRACVTVNAAVLSGTCCGVPSSSCT